MNQSLGQVPELHRLDALSTSEILRLKGSEGGGDANSGTARRTRHVTCTYHTPSGPSFALLHSSCTIIMASCFRMQDPTICISLAGATTIRGPCTESLFHAKSTSSDPSRPRRRGACLQPREICFRSPLLFMTFLSMMS